MDHDSYARSVVSWIVGHSRFSSYNKWIWEGNRIKVKGEVDYSSGFDNSKDVIG